MPRRFPALLAVTLSILLSACDVGGTRGPLPDEALVAERLFDEGDFVQAAAAFDDAARRDRSHRDALTLRAAESWREEGRIDEARPLLARLRMERLVGDEALRSNLLRAELALMDRDAQLALDSLSTPAAAVPESLRERFHFLRAQAFAAFNQPFSSAGERAALQAFLPAHEQAENSAAIRALLTQLPARQLSAAAAELDPTDPLYDFAADTLRALGLAVPGRRTGVRVRSGQAASIAVLLPRSGPLAAPANAVRDGVLSAYLSDPDNRPDLRFYDSGETDASAVAAYQTAVAEGAEHVIGPLSREQVNALFSLGDIRIPALALNRATVPTPEQSLSFALSPEDEGRAAARRIRSLGMSSVLLVASADDASLRAAQSLSLALGQEGGRVLHRIDLPSNSPNYVEPIRAAYQQLGWRESETTAPSAGAASSSTPVQRRVDVDVIYLATSGAEARLVIPQLRAEGGLGTPIMATSQIYAVGANPRLDRDLNGVEFTELPWLIDNAPADLPRAYELRNLDSAQGLSARLFAFGLDAYRLLQALPQLQDDASIEGATGRLSLDGFGCVLRQPGWAKYVGARPRALREDELLPVLNRAPVPR
ncbi:MAG: penicillin-binding protein activator [Lysobacteraceae bacterium]